MKYRLCCEITVSAFTIVEADSEKQAIKIAEGREPILYQEYDEQDAAKENWLICDADGSPMKIKIDK